MERRRFKESSICFDSQENGRSLISSRCCRSLKQIGRLRLLRLRREVPKEKGEKFRAPSAKQPTGVGTSRSRRCCQCSNDINPITYAFPNFFLPFFPPKIGVLFNFEHKLLNGNATKTKVLTLNYIGSK